MDFFTFYPQNDSERIETQTFLVLFVGSYLGFCKMLFFGVVLSLYFLKLSAGKAFWSKRHIVA